MGKPIWPQFQKLNIPTYFTDHKDHTWSSSCMASGFGSLCPRAGEEAGVIYGPPSQES